MLNNIKIRTGLTLIVCIFVAFLMTVIGVGYGALKQAMNGFQDVQRSSAALASLNASSEKLLQARLALGSFEILFHVGKPTDGLLASAQDMLRESNKDFQIYANGPFSSDAERELAQTVGEARAALVEQAIEPEYKALMDDDFSTFRAIQGDTADRSYQVYAKAIDTLEHLQSDSQGRSGEAMTQRFRISVLMFAGIGAAAILICLFARAMLSAALLKPVERAIEHFGRIAAGDLTGPISGHSHNEMGHLLGALKQMRGELADTVSKVRGSAGVIAYGVKEIAAGNLDLSARTEQQAASLERTAATIEELSSTVKQNADNAQEANRLAHGALETVTRGGAVVKRVIETMDDITGSSRKVSEIIGMIEGIAFQTNILSLNAAVEAARAGEQGRGFAVVASEVRSLAQRSATAAKEIKDLLSESAAQVEQGASLVAQAGGTMQEAMQAVERVTHIMVELEAAAHEQRSGIEQVNQAINQIDDVTQNNVALVEEAAAAAKSLEEQALVLREAVAVFRLEEAAAPGVDSRFAARADVQGRDLKRAASCSAPRPRIPTSEPTAVNVQPSSI
ncbi:methyl-accepting chemotaxis protein [Paraburkholderia phenazinium]|uniref:Methyl-accepting chemotaxis protein n=1 Tax=Paraburkholderia phenazinium TaxID=60549 RepID=A0A1G8MK89_9BURK|nr:methyl-accepting chemotaxis protein [Paraburkholderia phenazinium]SDI68235.1 Methyl-accepting chemotaxis protein [Paraburkholderia phenazinium]